MIAKLIKTEVNYLLKNEEGVIIASTSLKKLGLALSIKNCQAVELGYDLDELADKYYGPGDYGLEIKTGFIKGFEVAMRLMGDNKFSEDDVINAHSVGRNYQRNAEMDCHITPYLKSLQQTEWDVKIVMDILNEYDQPKLDADGCLILKRI